MNSQSESRWREGICCPLCNQSLLQNNKQWYCDSGHSFDIAKQGYTNLVPVQHKKSKSPGDDANMVSARTRFLNQNYYQPIADSLNQLLISYFQQEKIVDPCIVDAGCGEGYYTDQLDVALRNGKISSDITGIDISKHAILAAAKRNKMIRWFVANSVHLPVVDKSLDCVLSLFSPVPEKEFHRCLAKNGVLIVASTGANHLIELRNLLYDDVNQKTFNPIEAVAPYFKAANIEEHNQIESALPASSLQFKCHLENTATIKSLLTMTPHYWRVPPKRKELLNEIDQMTITVDIQLYLFNPKLQS